MRVADVNRSTLEPRDHRSASDPIRERGWHYEKESAWLYLQVAAAEPDPRKSRLFLQLSAAAEEQAAKWLSSSGHNPDRVFLPTLRARIVARLVRRFGPRSLRPVLAAMKLRGLSVYSAPAAGGGH